MLAVYLWPAFAAPVVLWSDSLTDMAWAREGLGIFRPIPSPPPGLPISHLPKPGYLLFLRLAMHLFPPLGESRSIVVTQSLLLALSIAGTSLWLSLRRGHAAGLLFAGVCLLFLRLRDSSSAVMPEALATALLLPIVALLLDTPRRRGITVFLGLAAGGLFLIRPNCGGVIFLLAVAGLGIAGEGRRLLFFFVGFVALAFPLWYISRSNLPGDPLHGLGFQIVEGSEDYYWFRSIHPWPVGQTPAEAASNQLRLARQRWRQTLAGREPDRSRQLFARGLHGLLGIEYYDQRWSRVYSAATTGSRLLSPFLILASIAILLVVPYRRAEPVKVTGLLLLAALVAENLLLGSNPRYVLPFLPALFLFAICGARDLGTGVKRVIALPVIFVGLLLLFAWQHYVLDWEWGKIERAGVALRQTIPRGALPLNPPAVIHLRVAPADPNSGAQWTLFVSGRTIASSETTDRRAPFLSAELPPWLLEENRHSSVELCLFSRGSYGGTSYLLFPVIPPPWVRLAKRDQSPTISPTTCIRWGALDWWAHRGTD